MSDEAMAVICLETDLSLKRRDTEWEMISRIHPAAVQFDLRDLPSFARHLLQLIGHLTCFLLTPSPSPKVGSLTFTACLFYSDTENVKRVCTFQLNSKE